MAIVLLKYLTRTEDEILINWKDKRLIAEIESTEEPNSEIHIYLSEGDENLDDLEIVNSKITLECDIELEEVYSIVQYEMAKAPSKEKLNILVEYTTAQLSDGYGEDCWIINYDQSEIGIFLLGNNYKPLSVNVLKSKGSTLDLKPTPDTQGIDELQEAILHDRDKLALKLIDSGVNLKLKNPIILACQKSNTKVVRKLLQNGVEINIDVFDAEYKTGGTPLIWATNRGNIKIITMLIAHGAKVNFQKEDGTTALFHSRKIEVTALLLQHGANINIKNKALKSAMEVAIEKLQKELKSDWKSEEQVVNYKKIIETLGEEKNAQ